MVTLALFHLFQVHTDSLLLEGFSGVGILRSVPMHHFSATGFLAPLVFKIFFFLSNRRKGEIYCPELFKIRQLKRGKK